MAARVHRIHERNAVEWVHALDYRWIPDDLVEHQQRLERCVVDVVNQHWIVAQWNQPFADEYLLRLDWLVDQLRNQRRNLGRNWSVSLVGTLDSIDRYSPGRAAHLVDLSASLPIRTPLKNNKSERSKKKDWAPLFKTETFKVLPRAQKDNSCCLTWHFAFLHDLPQRDHLYLSDRSPFIVDVSKRPNSNQFMLGTCVMIMENSRPFVFVYPWINDFHW